MEERDLHKLKRSELLEILLAQSEEIDRLRAEIESKDKQLADRSIAIQNAGSIAEASLQLTRVFVEAQTAADIYVANVKAQADKQAAEVADGYAVESAVPANYVESGATSAPVEPAAPSTLEAASALIGSASNKVANTVAQVEAEEAVEAEGFSTPVEAADPGAPAEAVDSNTSAEAAEVADTSKPAEAAEAAGPGTPAESAEPSASAAAPDPAAPATQSVPGVERYARSHYGSAGRANHAANAEAASALDSVNAADDLDDDDDEPPRGRHAFIPGKAVGAR